MTKLVRSKCRFLLSEAVDLILLIRSYIPTPLRRIPGVWGSLDRLEAIMKELEKKLGERDRDTLNGSGEEE